jgi:hypothetical protein
MNAMERRVDALEGGSGFYTIGELLDHLDGAPLPVGKMLSPAFVAAWSKWGADDDS